MHVCVKSANWAYTNDPLKQTHPFLCVIKRVISFSLFISQHSSAVDQENGAQVAIKKLSRPFQSIIHAKRTYRELSMLLHMKHDNVCMLGYLITVFYLFDVSRLQIIGLLDVFTSAANYNSFQDVYLVTQLMGSDLNNILRTQDLTDDHVQFLVYQILRGLKVIK